MALLIPTAGQCLAVAMPVASVGAVIWFLRHGDRLIARLFPHWEWERQLGWLNLKAHRRAETVMRGVRHLGHAFLLLDLVFVLGMAWRIGQPQDMDASVGVFTYFAELVYLGVGLTPWIYYFVAILRPRIIAEFEEDELRRYRAEHPEEDDEQPSTPPPRNITVWDTTRSFRRL